MCPLATPRSQCPFILILLGATASIANSSFAGTHAAFSSCTKTRYLGRMYNLLIYTLLCYENLFAVLDSLPFSLYVCLSVCSQKNRTRKLWCRKDDRAMRPIYGCHEFPGLTDYAHGYYSQHFSWAFAPIDPMNVRTKFEVRSFTLSWDNRGYPKNLDSPWIRPRSLFSKIFNGLLFGMAL